LRLFVTTIPGASKNEVVGRHGEGWKVRVKSPPERGRANNELVEMLAGVLGLPVTALRIVSGQTSKRKVVEVDGLAEEEAGRRLVAAARR
jgi:uncharacterized protein